MKPLIVANWKCNPITLQGAKRLFDSIKKGIKNIKKVEVVICPPFVYLPTLTAPTSIKGYGGLILGSQDCFWEEKGAFTGAISPKMIKDLGCKYVIVGHSERRRYLKETNEMVNKKIKIALALRLKPILCIGETRQEKKREQGLRTLNFQISKAFQEVQEKEAKNVIIAYEPVWAIGTGISCDVNTVLLKVLLIRGVIKKRYSPNISGKIRILYGGSVNAQNATDYIQKAKTNGLLIGGASLMPKEFIQIVKNVS